MDWKDLPANAKTIADIKACIDCLRERHPYPENMKIDRKNFALARVGYEGAIYNLERFMADMTEDLEPETDKTKQETNKGGDETVKCPHCGNQAKAYKTPYSVHRTHWGCLSCGRLFIRPKGEEATIITETTLGSGHTKYHTAWELEEISNRKKDGG